ncbi:M50 family metallopeptidase [Paractinoplanes durhamensis]|uniref:Membrane protein n=1 Tax=Paractinoplanes durhamensis TaxID=113563 RepID=A0ABQ3ZDF7_9ACTN|nr:M50 family metallopeptidase [Actinoplanes durhamensis]GIE07831.1 membrane protein [Actinoplanes durhamensis]
MSLFAAPFADGPSRLAWSAAVLSWLLAVPLWFVTKFVLVIAHEGGHALLAKLFFQKLKGISFTSGGGGATVPANDVPWLFNVLIFLAGYLGPSAFGLLGAWMLIHGMTAQVLWASLGFLVLMLFAVRGLLGWLLVPGLIAAIWLIATRVDEPQRTLYTHMWVWFLLIGAVQRMILFVLNRQYDDDVNDSVSLQALTLIPSAIWAFLFLVGTIAALTWGGALLLRYAT